MSKKVLLVDDSKGFSRVLREVILEAGWEVQLAVNGVEGLVRYLDGDIHMVLMDVIMPKLSGIDALRIIKKWDPDAKVVVFSGNPSDEMIREAMELGALNFLTKPFPIKKLIGIMQANLGNTNNGKRTKKKFRRRA